MHTTGRAISSLLSDQTGAWCRQAVRRSAHHVVGFWQLRRCGGGFCIDELAGYDRQSSCEHSLACAACTVCLAYLIKCFDSADSQVCLYPSVSHATWSDPYVGVSDAEALLQSLQLTEAEGKAFALTSMEGEGPGSDRQRWQALFQAT